MNTKQTPIELARDLAPEILEVADKIDKERRLPIELANKIADAGMFKTLLRKELGGAQLSIIDYLSVIQTLAEADGSTAWCVNQAAVFANVFTHRPSELAKEIFQNPRAAIANGPPSNANIVVVEGGYRFSGSWHFSSGCRHATWICAVAGIKSNSEVEKRSTPIFAFIPVSEIEFVDEWHVNGLRGTGSFGFKMSDQFIPEARIIKTDFILQESGEPAQIAAHLRFASGFAAVALGVARAGMDAAEELAGGKKPILDRTLLRDKPEFQQEIGRLEAIWHASREFLLTSATNIWAAAETESINLEHRILLRIASTHAIQMSSDVVTSAYKLCGSSSIFVNNPIQRRFQDVHAISQQIQGQLTHYKTGGQFFLGLDPKGAF